MRVVLRPLLPGESDWESLSVFVLIPVAAIGRLWLYFRLPLPACTLKEYTGCPCPVCGSTRAAHALFRNDVFEALKLNPLATTFAFLLILWCVYAIGAMTLAKGRRLRIDRAPRYAIRTFRGLIALSILANWAWIATHLPESPWHAEQNDVTLRPD